MREYLRWRARHSSVGDGSTQVLPPASIVEVVRVWADDVVRRTPVVHSGTVQCADASPLPVKPWHRGEGVWGEAHGAGFSFPAVGLEAFVAVEREMARHAVRPRGRIALRTMGWPVVRPLVTSEEVYIDAPLVRLGRAVARFTCAWTLQQPHRLGVEAHRGPEAH